MVTLVESIQVLAPNATFTPGNGTVLVADDGTGPRIVKWNVAALGTQPTPAALAAVTQAQVDAGKATIVSAAATAAKAEAAAVINGQRIDTMSRAMYAMAQLLVDDHNLMAGKLNAIGTALANASSTLATIRTAVNAIPGGLAPTYTLQQLVDAIVAKINAGQ